jgi:hypothetical protein
LRGKNPFLSSSSPVLSCLPVSLTLPDLIPLSPPPPPPLCPPLSPLAAVSLPKALFGTRPCPSKFVSLKLPPSCSLLPSFPSKNKPISRKKTIKLQTHNIPPEMLLFLPAASAHPLSKPPKAAAARCASNFARGPIWEAIFTHFTVFCALCFHFCQEAFLLTRNCVWVDAAGHAFVLRLCFLAAKAHPPPPTKLAVVTHHISAHTHNAN